MMNDARRKRLAKATALLATAEKDLKTATKELAAIASEEGAYLSRMPTSLAGSGRAKEAQRIHSAASAATSTLKKLSLPKIGESSAAFSDTDPDTIADRKAAARQTVQGKYTPKARRPERRAAN